MFTTTRLLAVLAVIAGLLTPLCAPSFTFAALPSNELWRENLVNNVVGFGKNTTGGKGGTLCKVSNLNDSGTGSLRSCATASGAQWIVFSVSGTINLSSAINLGSNKTIDGRGQNIVISGAAGLFLNNVSNVILHNFTVQTTSDDGIQISNGSTNVWVDHITFGDSGDEQLDIGSLGVRNRAPSGITVSWNHFLYIPTTRGSGAILVSDHSTPQDAATTITFHHNHYDHTYVRHPLARWATIHSFNNYYNKNEIGAQISASGQFYSENEIFNAPYAGAYLCVHPDPYAATDGSEPPAANVKVINPWLLNNATYLERNPATIFNPLSYYPYTADTANATLQSRIINEAGRQDVTSRPSSTISPPEQLHVLR